MSATGGWRRALERLDGASGMSRATVDEAGWTDAARDVALAGGRLVALWGTDRRALVERAFVVSAAFATSEGLTWLDLPVADPEHGYPDLSGLFPCAVRMQRAAADLTGVKARDQVDERRWLDHGAWAADGPPLSADAAGAGPTPAAKAAKDYPFVRVEGDGVHEIPVGPVHAGIIEPGHFRFSVVGEKVLRLEERLGYTHKGVERRMSEWPPEAAYKIAGRVSGDSTVAYATAYCMALETALRSPAPRRAVWLRALMLERERVANHLGDLGMLGNDAAFAVALAHFSRLKEDWLRESGRAFGHRMMMDGVVPGGVARDPAAPIVDDMRRECDRLAPAVSELRTIFEEHAGLQDRFMTTGQVSRELAGRLGLTGLAARASGIASDLRRDHPYPPYDELDVNAALRSTGDVAARVEVRFDEIFESLRLIGQICERLPRGETVRALPLSDAKRFGAGWVEGWRGEILVALELDGPRRIARCHLHDPSWQNWPVLEHAVIGNIVPDFPLINKSFNLSYSGHDL